MAIPFIDLKAQYEKIGAEIEDGVLRVLRSGQYILGPEVDRLEAALADFVGVKHAISCASGTDALMITLMAMGIGPGDAVLTTPFTFMATAEAIALLGASPVFVDIDAATYNLDPEALEQTLSARKGISSDLVPKAIIAVDLFGLPADYAQINAVAARHGVAVIEDAAQSFGASLNGVSAGRLAPVGCTSFFPAKPLGGCGDGGALFTDDDDMAALFRSIRVHGQGEDRYDNVRLGLTGRLDAMQAAVLLPKLRIFPDELAARQHVAKQYKEELRAAGATVTLPAVPAGYESAWAQYSLLARDGDHRQRLIETLKQAGVPTMIYYPKPLHLQRAFAGLGHRPGDFPVAEDIASCIFSIPMHPYLDPETIRFIARTIAEHKS